MFDADELSVEVDLTMPTTVNVFAPSLTVLPTFFFAVVA